MAIRTCIQQLPQGVIGSMGFMSPKDRVGLARSVALGPMHPTATGSQLLLRVGLVVRPRRAAPRAPPGTAPPVVTMFLGLGVAAVITGLRLSVVWMTCRVAPLPPPPRHIILRLRDRLCLRKCMAHSRRPAAAANGAAGHSEHEDLGLPMMKWMTNADGADLGEASPSGCTYRISEQEAALTASWQFVARSADALRWRPIQLGASNPDPCTRCSLGIKRLRAAEFEGGLNPSCSRLGAVPAGTLAMPMLHAQFVGGYRRLGQGKEFAIVLLHVLRREIRSYNAHWTTMLSAWRRGRALGPRRAACLLPIASLPCGSESSPGVAPPLPPFRTRLRLPCGLATGSAMPPCTPLSASLITASQGNMVAAIAT